MHVGWQERDNEKIEKLTQLGAQPSYRRGHIYESFEQGKELPPPLEIETPKIELKPFPSMSFFGTNKTLLMIVSTYLDEEQQKKLLRVLKKHKRLLD